MSSSSSEKDYFMKVPVLWCEIPLCNCVPFLLISVHGKLFCLLQQWVNMDFNLDAN